MQENLSRASSWTPILFLFPSSLSASSSYRLLHLVYYLTPSVLFLLSIFFTFFLFDKRFSLFLTDVSWYVYVLCQFWCLWSQRLSPTFQYLFMPITLSSTLLCSNNFPQRCAYAISFVVRVQKVLAVAYRQRMQGIQ